MKKALSKKGDARQKYFLDSIVQGSCVSLAEEHIYLNEDQVPTCNLCHNPVTGCAFRHFSYHCLATCSLETPGVEGSKHLVEQAQVELDTRPALWLRGLLPLDMPDPLDHRFSYLSSFSILDVTGLILAGDGSGGRASKDFRTRRCGFGLAIINSNVGAGILDNNFHECPMVLGYASGSVPGKQTTPRAEAVALLFALIFTIGTATYVCDNLGVVQRYKNLGSRTIKGNGLLWSMIAKASMRNSSAGNGYLDVVWLPSHLTLETAMNRSYSPSNWVAKLARQLLDISWNRFTSRNLLTPLTWPAV